MIMWRLGIPLAFTLLPVCFGFWYFFGLPLSLSLLLSETDKLVQLFVCHYLRLMITLRKQQKLTTPYTNAISICIFDKPLCKLERYNSQEEKKFIFLLNF